MRKSSGMTEDNVAKKLKLSKFKYLSIETGKEKYHQTHLIQLANTYKKRLIAFYSPDKIARSDFKKLSFNTTYHIGKME